MVFTSSKTWQDFRGRKPRASASPSGSLDRVPSLQREGYSAILVARDPYAQVENAPNLPSRLRDEPEKEEDRALERMRENIRKARRQETLIASAIRYAERRIKRGPGIEIWDQWAAMD